MSSQVCVLKIGPCYYVDTRMSSTDLQKARLFQLRAIANRIVGMVANDQSLFMNHLEIVFVERNDDGEIEVVR